MFVNTEFVSGLQRGEKRIFDQIYKHFWAELYTFVRKRVNSDEDAKDILQDLFVEIWTKRESLNILTSLKSYLYTALRHRIINYYNSNCTRSDYLDILSKMEQFNEATEEQVAQNEINAIIEKSLDKMPPKMREVFELSRFGDTQQKKFPYNYKYQSKPCEIKSLMP